MLSSDFLFSVFDQDQYENPGRYEASREFAQLVERLLPPNWSIQRHSIWLQVTPPLSTVLPSQGFKIHLSSAPFCSADILQVVVPICLEHDVGFKLVADRWLLEIMNSARYGRSQSGKFITLYPWDESSFRRVIEALYQNTINRPFVGPYILSDRRYRESRILSYRYGAFGTVRQLSVDGSIQPLILAPDGSQQVDNPRPYFALPPGVQDPFESVDEQAVRPAPLLAGRFRLEALLEPTNAGNMYEGTDLHTGRKVVIKEARPFTSYLTQEGAIDTLTLLRREYDVLTRLNDCVFTPRPVALFEEWEHLFLAELRPKGTLLYQFFAMPGHIMLPYIRRPGTLAHFLPIFRVIGESLIRGVQAIHLAGVRLGDISISNVWIHDKPLRASFVDLTGARIIDRADQPTMREGHDSAARQYQDISIDEEMRRTDIHRLGMILLNSVLPMPHFEELRPDTHKMLYWLEALGIPTPVLSTIEHLLRADTESTSRAMESLTELPNSA